MLLSQAINQEYNLVKQSNVGNKLSRALIYFGLGLMYNFAKYIENEKRN